MGLPTGGYTASTGDRIEVYWVEDGSCGIVKITEPGGKVWWAVTDSRGGKPTCKEHVDPMICQQIFASNPHKACCKSCARDKPCESGCHGH